MLEAESGTKRKAGRRSGKRDGSDIVKLGGPADVRAIFTGEGSGKRDGEAESGMGPEAESGTGPIGSGKRDEAESGTGPILLNWAAPPTSERSSPGRGILISVHLSRATRGTIGRLEAQTLRDFLLPFRLAKGAASLHAAAKRFQFLRVVGLIDPLEPIRRHIDRPRRQQRPLFSRRMTALPQA